MTSRARIAVAGALAAACLALAIAASVRAPVARADASVPRVPFARELPVLDGALEDAAWRDGVLRSGPFRGEDGKPSAPHTEARFLWRDGRLVIALYAADIDVESTDRMRVLVSSPSREVAFEVGPRGGAALPAGVTVAREADEATIDDRRDRDEEWTAEAAIDLAAVGLRGAPGERLSVRLARCDVTPEGESRCSSWRPTSGFVELGAP